MQVPPPITPSRLAATLTLTVAVLFGHACGSSTQSKLSDAAANSTGGAATGGNTGGSGGIASGGISGTGGTGSGTGGTGTGGAPATGGATTSAAAGGTVGTGGTVGAGGTLAKGGASGTGGTGVDSGSSNSCMCTAASTTLECFCSKYSCPDRLGYFLMGGGAAGVYSTLEEFADCNLVLVTTPTGRAPDRYVFERSTQRLVGARYSSDVLEACPWDGDASGFRVLTAGRFPDSTCVRSACQKGILPDVMGTCADAGI